jgi:hypothetical protein
MMKHTRVISIYLFSCLRDNLGTDETTSKKRAAISFTYEDQPAEKKSQNLFDLDDDENDDQKPYEVPEGLKLPEGLNKVIFFNSYDFRQFLI